MRRHRLSRSSLSGLLSMRSIRLIRNRSNRVGGSLNASSAGIRRGRARMRRPIIRSIRMRSLMVRVSIRRRRRGS
eukprot:765457-Pyramimonas_sp.AAC.1